MPHNPEMAGLPPGEINKDEVPAMEYGELTETGLLEGTMRWHD